MTNTPETETSLTANYSALADMARSLTRTLQNAPASESRRAAALRSSLSQTAAGIAAFADSQENGADSGRFATCYTALGLLSAASIPLTRATAISPQGVGVMLQTLVRDWLPETYFSLQPVNDVECYMVDFCLDTMIQLLRPLGLPPRPAGTPQRFVQFCYPQGEQDNILLTSVLTEALIHSLYGLDQPNEATEYPLLLAETLGPAIFFALADQAHRVFLHGQESLDEDSRYLLFALYHALKSLGWESHPQIGPLLKERKHELNKQQVWAAYSDPPKLSAVSRQGRLAALQPFTPQDFDRKIPVLWERLRQILPPNELELDAVESTQPADAVTILNAGWSFYLLHMPELYETFGANQPEDRYEVRRALNRLLIKGIELAAITRQWQEARG